MTLYILGSASGIPTQQRFNSSMVLEIRGNIYLFDVGEPCSALLVRNKIDYDTIRCIFISHMHADHSSGVFQLIQTLQLSSILFKKSSLKVIDLFVPKEAVEVLKEMFHALYLMPETLPFLLKTTPLQEGCFYKDNHLRVKVIANEHLRKGYKETLQNIQTKYPNAFQSYSFLIEGEGKKILYSGDISDISELDKFLDDVDLLILELAHIAPREVFRSLSKRAIPKVILTHLHPKFDNSNKNQLSQLQAQIKDYMPDRIIIAKDGLTIKL